MSFPLGEGGAAARSLEAVHADVAAAQCREPAAVHRRDWGLGAHDPVLEEVEDPSMPRPRKYPPELLDRGARVVIETGRPIAHVARDLGMPSETLRKYVRQIEADEGLRPDLPSTQEREEIKALRKEVYELRRANEILKAASVFFATELDADRTK